MFSCHSKEPRDAAPLEGLQPGSTRNRRHCCLHCHQDPEAGLQRQEGKAQPLITLPPLAS